MKKIIIVLIPIYVLLYIVYLQCSDKGDDIDILNERIKAYEFVGDFHEDRAVVKKNGKIGFIDKTGELVIPLKWELDNEYALKYEIMFEDGRCLIRPSDGNSVLIGRDGDEIYSSKSMSIRKIGDKRLLRIGDGNAHKSSFWMDKKSITKIEEVEDDELVISDIYNYNKPESLRSCVFTFENLCDGEIVGKDRLSKEFGYQHVPSRHCLVDTGGNDFGLVTLLNEKTNKYGIVDQKGNIVVPFEYDRNIAIYYGMLIELISYAKDTECGVMKFPYSCNVYKDGRLLQEKLPFFIDNFATMGIFLFKGDSISNIRERLEVSESELEIPESVETTVFLDADGNKVSRFPFGKNYLRYNEDGKSDYCWQLENEDGTLVYPKKFKLESRLKNGIEIEASGQYDHLYMTDTGDTILSVFAKYLYYGIVKMTDRFPQEFYPLCDYNKDLSERDNYLNCHYSMLYRKQGGNYDVIKSDGTKIIPYGVDEVFNFSDGLLRLRLGKRYFFINENGEGMIKENQE